MLVDGFCQGHEYSVQEVHTSGDMYAFSGLIDAGPTKIQPATLPRVITFFGQIKKKQNFTDVSLSFLARGQPEIVGCAVFEEVSSLVGRFG